MESKDSRKFAIYSRKSKFTGKGESIENQIEMCRHHIKMHYNNIDDDDICIFEDEGFSGGNTNRPKFQQMMKDIRENQIQAVVCYRLDRISRNVGDFAKLKEEFDNYGTSFISIKDNFDTTTPTGNAMMMMVSVFAQLERDTIAERIKDNMHELAKSGRWLGGTTPTGYQSTELVGSVTADGKVRKAFKLDIIKEEAELIKQVYSKFMETNSLTKTETYLLQNHINTKNNKEFSRFAIKGVLINPVYMIADKDAWQYFNSFQVDIHAEESDFNGKHGIMAYNKTIQKPGKTNQIRNLDEWIIAVGKHKGLITGADWVKVQNMLNQNKSKSYRKPKSNVALLSGLLFCGHCNSFMRPKLSKRINADGEQIYSYLCETKEKSRMHNCQMKNPNGNELDKVVCNHIKALSYDTSHFIKQLEKAKQIIVGNREEYDLKLDNLKKSFSDNEKEIKALVSALARSEDIPAYDYITEQINQLHEKNENIKQQITEFESLTQNNVLSDKEFEIAKELIQNFNLSFDTLSIEQKRSALRSFIKRIVWDGENVHVFLFGSDDNTPITDDFSESNQEPKRGDSE